MGGKGVAAYFASDSGLPEPKSTPKASKSSPSVSLEADFFAVLKSASKASKEFKSYLYPSMATVFLEPRKHTGPGSSRRSFSNNARVSSSIASGF